MEIISLLSANFISFQFLKIFCNLIISLIAVSGITQLYPGNIMENLTVCPMFNPLRNLYPAYFCLLVRDNLQNHCARKPIKAQNSNTRIERIYRFDLDNRRSERIRPYR